MVIKEYQAKVRWALEETMCKGNADAMEQISDPKVTVNIYPFPEIKGVEALKKYFLGMSKGFSDVRIDWKEIISEAETNASRYTIRMKHTGTIPNLPIPPTGKEVVLNGCTFNHVKNGKDVEVFQYNDNLGMFQQLGIVPPMGQEIMEDYLAAWNSHDVNKILSFFTDDAVYEDVPLGMIARGKKEITTFVNNAFVDFPDFKIEVKAAGEWVMSGTFTHSSIPSMPATGKTFSIRGASITEYRNGKIIRNADYYNAADFMQQVGLMPKQPQK